MSIATKRGAARRNARLLGFAMLATYLGTRTYLHAFPGTDLDVLGYNIHHLFTGISSSPPRRRSRWPSAYPQAARATRFSWRSAPASRSCWTSGCT